MEVCVKIKLFITVGLLSSLFGVMHVDGYWSQEDLRIDPFIELIRSNNSDGVKQFLSDSTLM